MNNTRKIVSPRVKEIKFIPSSNYHNHVYNKKPYDKRGATYLGQLVFPMGPRLKEDVK